MTDHDILLALNEDMKHVRKWMDDFSEGKCGPCAAEGERVRGLAARVTLMFTVAAAAIGGLWAAVLEMLKWSPCR